MSVSTIYSLPKTSRHYLFEIDRDKKNAYCSACGWTEIHIPQSHTKENPKIFCIKRFRELRVAQIEKSRSKSGWKPQHLLSDIDVEKLTAMCSVCGLTEVWKHNINGSIIYTCATKERAYERKYKRNWRSSNTSKPNAHSLSQIDEETKTAICSICGPVTIYIWQGKRKIGRRCSNAPVARIPGALEIRQKINTNMINRYKVLNGCKNCGYNTNHLGLSIYRGSGGKHPVKIEKLLKLNGNQLMQKLEKCEILCVSCR